jgi:hypothetical protein
MVLRKDSEEEIVMRVSLAHVFNLAALVAFAGTATMQGAEQARFHLSTPAHWGEVVLPPGDYEVLLPAPAVGRTAFRIEGAGKSMYEFPLTTDKSQNYSASSYLKLEEIDGSYFVREYSSGPTGRTFTFSIPKQTRHQEMAKRRDNSIVLSVR